MGKKMTEAEQDERDRQLAEGLEYLRTSIRKDLADKVAEKLLTRA